MLMPKFAPTRALRFGLADARTWGLALLFAIVIIWQLPHVIVLRYAVLIILGVLSWGTAYRALRRKPLMAFVVYAVFLAWCLVVALFVSQDARSSLNELRAEWLPTTLCLLMGYGLALRFGAEVTVRVVFWALMAHAVLHLGSALGVFIASGSAGLRDFAGISDHRANVTYTSTIALAMLLADIAAAPGRAASPFGLKRGAQLALFVLLLASTLVSATRNGLIVFLLVTLAGGAFIAMSYRGTASRRWWAIAAACLAFTVAGAAIGIKADARWSGFLATVPVAWDTEGHRNWLKGELNYTDLPDTALGKPVEPSAYYRIAYLKEGVKLLVEHPWGTQIGRDAFNRLIHAKYGTAGMSHAHNGLIDLGLSVGFPGMALWLAFLFLLAGWGLRGWSRERDPVGLALFLAVLGFGTRMLLDSTLRDHVIEEFALIAALLAGALAARSGAREHG